MDSTLMTILLIAVPLILIVILVLVLVSASRKKAANRDRAGELREEAQAGAAGIGASRDDAELARARAEEARREAEQAEVRAAEAEQTLSHQEATYEERIREADRLDPDVRHTSSDYSPNATPPELDDRPAPQRGGTVESALAGDGTYVDTEGVLRNADGSPHETTTRPSPDAGPRHQATPPPHDATEPGYDTTRPGHEPPSTGGSHRA